MANDTVTEPAEAEAPNLGAPTGSKEAYLKAQSELLPGYTPTIDALDENVGTTTFTDGGIPLVGSQLPGQVFAPWQLPNPQAALKAGLPAVTVPEHLIFDHDEAVAHVQGPDALDIATHQIRESLGYPMLGTATGPSNPLGNQQIAADEPKASTSSKTSQAEKTAAES